MIANGDWPLVAAVVLDGGGVVVQRFAYPEDGFASKLGQCIGGGDATPSWDQSGTQLLLKARGADDAEVVWLADIESGELTEVHRAQLTPPTFGEVWIGVAFGP